jgi:hypothetical protein
VKWIACAAIELGSEQALHLHDRAQIAFRCDGFVEASVSKQ